MTDEKLYGYEVTIVLPILQILSNDRKTTPEVRLGFENYRHYYRWEIFDSWFSLFFGASFH